jgi:hypothetical protein
LARFTLTDVASEFWVDQFVVDSTNRPRLAGSSNWSIQKRTLRGGVSNGIDVISVDNGALKFDILPTRGMGIWRGQYRDIRLGWDSPARFPVHPTFVNQVAQNGCGWLSGFNEWICRCGLESVGRPPSPDVGSPKAAVGDTNFTLHGHIANTPANWTEVEIDVADKGTLFVRGHVEEARLFGPKFRLETTISTVVGSNSLTISDSIVNCSDYPMEMQLLYHTNLGPPILEEGSRIIAAATEVASYDQHAANAIDEWHSFRGPAPGSAEECYFFKLTEDADGRSRVMLANASNDRGVSMSFMRAQLPCFTLWKNTAGLGDGYVAGFEPGTNYPLPRAMERRDGRLSPLLPGAIYNSSLEISVHAGRGEVDAVESLIRRVQPKEMQLIRANYVD